MAEIAFAVRTCLAAAIFLAAGWKLSHRSSFSIAFGELTPHRIASAARWAVWPISLVEIATAGLLVAGQYVGLLSWAGAAAAVFVIGIFTLALGVARAPFECGCWASSTVEDAAGKLQLVFRNLVLLALAVTILSLGRGHLSLLPAAAELPMGALAALLIVELPNVAAVARNGSHRPITSSRP